MTIRLGFSDRVRHMTTAERERLERLHDDAATAALVKELLKSNSGIPRLADERWLRVSAPQGLAAEAPRHVWLALQDVRRLLDDAETAPLVKELLKSNSGIARLADEAWLRVSAPQR